MNTPTEPPTPTPPAETPPPRRPRRWLLIGGLSALALLVGLGLLAWYWVRSGRVNNYVADQIVTALKEYGIRAEVGGFEIGRGLRTAAVRDVKLYNQQTGQLIATLERAVVTIEIRERYALRLSREIAINELEVSGLNLYAEFDAAGRSNFDGVRQPPPRAEQRITFDTSGLAASLGQSALHYKDERYKLQADLGNLKAQAQTVAGDHAGVKLTLNSTEGRVALEGREARVNGLEIAARATQSGVVIETLKLGSEVADVTASGRVENYSAPRYQINTETRLFLDDAMRLVAPDAKVGGEANFKGQVTGEGAKYSVAGRLDANELTAAGVRVRGALVEDVKLEPGEDEATLLRFSSRLARAASIAGSGFTAADVAANNVSGTFRNGRTELTAARASAARASADAGAVSGAALTNVKASFGEGAGTTSVRGDLTLAGGTADKIRIGQTRGQLAVTGGTVALNNFTAALLGGSAKGNLNLNTRGGASRAQVQFTGLQTGDLVAAFSPQPVPVAGTVTGRADVTWPGTNVTRLSGTLNADFAGQTTETPSAIPLTGVVAARLQSGVANFDRLSLRTDATTLDADGSVALVGSRTGDSDLRFTLASSRAEELLLLASAVPAAKEAIGNLEPSLAGDFRFEGTLSGSLTDPTLAGKLNASSVGLQDTVLGGVTGRLLFSPAEIRFEDGTLTAPNGGTARVNYAAPRDADATSGKLDATFERLSLDDLIAASGFPLKQKLVSGEVSGEAHLTGLPASPQGNVTANLVNGVIAGQPAESATVAVNFDRQQARVERLEAKLPQGSLSATGSFNLQTNEFQAEGLAAQINLAELSAAFALGNVNLGGTADATFQASGNAADIDQLKVELNAEGKDVTLNGRDAGVLKLTARTSPGGRIDAELVTGIAGQPQPITASVELKKEGMPVTVESTLTNFDLTPVLAVFAPALADTLDGSVTGRVRLAGPLQDERGEMSLARLTGGLTLTEVALTFGGNRINVETPVTVALADSALRVEPTRFYGQNTSLSLGGVIGLAGDAGFNFSLGGNFNLDALNLLTSDFSFGGAAAVDVRLTGTAEAPRLAGEIRVSDLALSSLSSPVAVDNGQARVVLAGDKIVLESFTANANDGMLRASGEAALDGLRPARWEFKLTAEDVNVFYQGARIVAEGALTLAGTPHLQTLSGRINVPAAEYTTAFSFDGLASSGGGFSFGGGFGGGGLGGGGGPSLIPPVNLDIRVEAIDSFLVRNEQVNTVASATINVGGTLSEPDVSGRVTLEGGTIEFRDERYEIVSGTLLLPGGFGTSPQVNLLAEGDVSGYRVSIGLIGPLSDVQVTLRSEPELARAEILTLLTTGRTDGGTLNSDTIVRSGLGTAASLLSSEFISEPLGRGAERLLGLNRFQIDPVLNPNANPAARLTIGRQIARDLTFTYSTNLASEQDQTAILEYNLTNRFSAIAAYTQGGSSTQQGARDNDFTIEVRGRKRFALGTDRALLSASPPGGASTSAGTPAREARRTLPPAAVDVNRPDAIKLDDDTLRELLPVKREGYSRALLRLGERNLVNHLQEKGYFFAEVRSRCEPATCSGPDLRVLYDVSPGERYDLKEIRLTGTDELSEREALGELQTQPEGLLGGVPFFERLPFIGGTARGITSNDRLRNDREALRRRMTELGFRSARVTSRLAVSPENDNLVVIFDIEEGPRSLIADVSLRGNAMIEADELQREIPVEVGESFSPTAIRTGAQQVRNLYAARGYLDVKVEPSVVDLPDNRVRLIYTVSEGARAVVDDVRVAGNVISEEKAIRRFFEFRKGDVLTPQMIDRVQRDLYATGAFREVNVRHELLPSGVAPAGAEASARRVTVGVTEAKPLLLVYGLGYSTDEGPRALAQLTHTNLFGRVVSGSLRLRGSRREQLAQLQFTDLRPFGSPWATTFSTFYSRNADLLPFTRRRLVDGKVETGRDGRSFGINRFAAFIQSERKFGEQTSVRLRYSFENAKLFNLQNVTDIEVTRNERAVRLGIVSAGVSRDTRDSVLSATRGQLVSADYSLATRAFGGNESFNKFFGNYQRYHTLGDKLPVLGGSTLAFSARIGLSNLFRKTDRDGNGTIDEAEQRLPISERFFAGGATSLRGFRFEQAGPQGVLEPRNAGELPTLVPLGGNALAVFNLELRYPLTRRLQAVPFYDIGNVFRSVKDIFRSRCVERPGSLTPGQVNNLCADWTNTVGLGLRFNTPVGPVGIDYGYILDPPAFLTATGATLRQPRGVIHIRFGQTF